MAMEATGPRREVEFDDEFSNPLAAAKPATAQARSPTVPTVASPTADSQQEAGGEPGASLRTFRLQIDSRDASLATFFK